MIEASTTACQKVRPCAEASAWTWALTFAANAFSSISRNCTADVLLSSIYAPGNINPSSDTPPGRLLRMGKLGTGAPAPTVAIKSAPVKLTGLLSTAAAICSSRQPGRTEIVQGQFALRDGLEGNGLAGLPLEA